VPLNDPLKYTPSSALHRGTRWRDRAISFAAVGLRASEPAGLRPILPGGVPLAFDILYLTLRRRSHPGGDGDPQRGGNLPVRFSLQAGPVFWNSGPTRASHGVEYAYWWAAGTSRRGMRRLFGPMRTSFDTAFIWRGSGRHERRRANYGLHDAYRWTIPAKSLPRRGSPISGRMKPRCRHAAALGLLILPGRREMIPFPTPAAATDAGRCFRICSARGRTGDPVLPMGLETLGGRGNGGYRRIESGPASRRAAVRRPSAHPAPRRRLCCGEER